MTIEYSTRFQKNYRRRILSNKKLKHQFEIRLQLFLLKPDHPLLRDHALVGDLSGFRSFSLTGDYRVIYQLTDSSCLLFDIGTHNQLYR